MGLDSEMREAVRRGYIDTSVGIRVFVPRDPGEREMAARLLQRAGDALNDAILKGSLSFSHVDVAGGVTRAGVRFNARLEVKLRGLVWVMTVHDGLARTRGLLLPLTRDPEDVSRFLQDDETS